MSGPYPKVNPIVREEPGSGTGETLYQTADGVWWTTGYVPEATGGTGPTGVRHGTVTKYGTIVEWSRP